MPLDTDMFSGFKDGSSDGQGGITLNIPKRSGSEYYVGQIMGTIRVFTNIIATMQNITDSRIVPAARQCIITISDDKIRYAMLTKFRDALAAIEKDSQHASVEQKAAVIMEVCQVIVGEVYSFADEFLGISKINVVAPLATFPLGLPGGNGNEALPLPKEDQSENIVEPLPGCPHAAAAALADALGEDEEAGVEIPLREGG